VQVFWGLDKNLAKRKHFPSVNWNLSFSSYDRILEEYYSNVEPEFMSLKTQLRKILQQEDELVEIVQLVGKDSLSEDQKAILKTAQIIKDEFLQQDAFSKYDYNCPLLKTAGMMKAICKFFDNCMRVITDTAKSDKKISMGFIESTLKNNVMDKLYNMKFLDPLKPELEVRQYFDEIVNEIDLKFRDMVI